MSPGRRWGKRLAPDRQTQYSDLHEIEPAQLPCWDHMTPEVAGPKVVRERHPHYRPNGAKKSPTPKVHTATKTERDDFYEALQYFLVEYREASERLRSGELGVPFPDGCFPPALPFVGDEGRPRAP